MDVSNTSGREVARLHKRDGVDPLSTTKPQRAGKQERSPGVYPAMLAKDCAETTAANANAWLASRHERSIVMMAPGEKLMQRRTTVVGDRSRVRV